MASELAGTVVVVTGASRGIGLETALRFAAAGASVGMLGRDGEALAAAASRVDGPVATAVADVADVRALRDAIASVEERLGPADVLVNNAGHGVYGAVLDTGEDEFRRAVEVNFLGTVHATAAVLPGMLVRGHGRIVNLASIAGRIGAPFEAAYSASKFAVVGYSEALAAELAGTGVSVSLVNPGPVDTDFFARRGHPYELARPRPIAAGAVADAVVRAARDGSAELYRPRWMRLATVTRIVAPAVYRAGVRRAFARPRAALRERIATMPAAPHRSSAQRGGDA